MVRSLLAAAALCALALVPPRASAQETPDTTAAWRYVPLAVGNVWEYVSTYDGADHPERRTVAADTLIGGVRYVRYDRQPLSAAGAPAGPRTSSYLRFDTLATALRAWDGAAAPPHDLIAGCAVGAPFGSVRECPSPFGSTCTASYGGGYGQTIEVGGDAVVTSVKTLETGGCELNSRFAAGLGLVSFATLGGHTRLRYALVDGAAYGDPITADVEAAPEAAVTVRVAPNPARGTLLVTLRRADAGAVRAGVYDAQGRQVARLHDGPLGAGAHPFTLDLAALPAGAYVVGVSGADGTAAVPFTVAR